MAARQALGLAIEAAVAAAAASAFSNIGGFAAKRATLVPRCMLYRTSLSLQSSVFVSLGNACFGSCQGHFSPAVRCACLSCMEDSCLHCVLSSEARLGDPCLSVPERCLPCVRNVFVSCGARALQQI
eukprot:4018266-Pleurochrysis_carterae.AAC.1